MIRGTIATAMAALLLLACGGTPAPSGGAGQPSGGQSPAGDVWFQSTQGQPVNEAQAMRTVLSGFNGTAKFDSSKPGTPVVQQVLAEQQAGKGTIDVLGDLQGDMVTLQKKDALEDLTPLMQRLAKDRHFDPNLAEYGKLGTGKQYYIPWIQGVYLMVANKKALPYLPKGADLNNLTYDQLIQWAANMEKGTGEKKMGLPANTASGGGLIGRFVQGYMLPSYTGTEVTGFKSAEAVKGWEMVRQLWQHTSAQSPSYSQMQEPLQSGEVWVAWDHQARLINALKNAPDQFVAFPSPQGPKGLGYMRVLGGLAIPKNAPNKKGAEALIDYLTRSEIQIKTTNAIAFAPALTGLKTSGGDQDGGAKEAQAADKMTRANRALEAMLPVGLGAKDADFSKAYKDSFEQIILQNKDIQAVLNDQAGKMQAILNSTSAPCWKPDKPSDGPCQIAG